MKKKLVSLSLALAMCLSLVVTASAADVPSEYEIPDGEYTLVRQGTGEFVEKQIRTGYGVDQLDEEYTTVHTGYYSLSPDSAWTVTNTSADPNALFSISAEYYVPLGNNDYGAGVGYGALIDRNGLTGGSTANGGDWDNMDRLRRGDSVTFTLADVLANEKEGIEDLNIHVGRAPNETNGIVLVVGIHKDYVECDEDGYTTLLDSTSDWYCYMIGENQPGDPTAPGSTGFTDVKSGDWFYEPVQWAVKEGVTNGTSLTTFSPSQDCTVAHILTFLWRANGSPKAEGDNPFSDVKADDWFCGAALWAQEQGMVTGDTFGPDTPCTRSMAVKYLWQAAGSPSAKASNFSDVPAGADYAQAVNWAVEKGITNGTSLTNFSPSEVCTRGHIVTFLYRDLAK